MLQTAYPCQLIGDQRRLVETARPQPRPVERHRCNQYPRPVIGQMSRQLPSDHLRQPDLAAIFEPKHHLPRDIVIGGHRPDTVMRRWIGEAGGAGGILALIVREGLRAFTAPGGREETEPLPATGAEHAAVGRNRPAGRASFGQNKIKRRFENLRKVQHLALVCHPLRLHKAQMSATPPEIFDRKRRRAFRERAGQMGGCSFLWEHIAEDLAERLSLVSRQFDNILVIGPLTALADRIMGERSGQVVVAPLSLSEATQPDVLVIEEDRLPFEPGSFDLIISAGTLDSVNDLPGALVQMRRALRPDGLLLAHMFGAGSWARLKALMLMAEGDNASPHIHPQIDLRSAADLLTRAGFALPVADQDIMPVRYGGWRNVVADLRSAGLGNTLAGPRRYLGKDILARLDAAWQQTVDETGRAGENVVHLHLSGWAPSPDQPQPAARGSGVSLAGILPDKAKS